jgi:hypothetical protein
MANSFSHRILTEDVNRQVIIEILSKYFESFNVTETLGYWEGQAEKSLSIELIGASEKDVLRASEEIRVANAQEAIMVFSITGKSRLVIA